MYVNSRQVAQRLGCETRDARRIMQRAGMARKQAGRVHADEEQLGLPAWPHKERLWSVGDLARHLGWKTHRARRWMLRAGLGFKVGKRWYISPLQCRALYGVLWSEGVTDDEIDPAVRAVDEAMWEDD